MYLYIMYLYINHDLKVMKLRGGSPGGGGGGKFWILVLLRDLRAKRQYFKPPRSHLEFPKETQNYVKRNRSQIFFLTYFV